MKPAQLWPIAIVGVLAITVGANIFLFKEARDGNGAATEPDYYRKGLAWDSTMAQARADVAMGWTLDAQAGPVGLGLGVVTCTLKDSTGAPLTGATVTLEAIHNLEAEHYVHATLAPRAAGEYVSAPVLTRPGLWELRFTARRGAQVYTNVVRRDAAKAAAR
jgi:nitrogen fixation protein FixH